MSWSFVLIPGFVTSLILSLYFSYTEDKHDANNLLIWAVLFAVLMK